MQNDIYEFYKNNETDEIWWVSHYILIDASKGLVDGNIDKTVGEHLFSFDKKKIYNLFEDYPNNLSKEEKEIFNKENPDWKEFFKDRQ